MIDSRRDSARSTGFVWLGPGCTQYPEWPGAAPGVGVSAPGAPEALSADGQSEPTAEPSQSEAVWIDAANVGQWIGEDGGPGARTGLARVLDDEEVGAVVVPPTRSEAFSALFHFALEHPTLFFFVPAADPSVGELLELSRPLVNVALVRAPRGAKVAVEAIETLVDLIAARDFAPVVASSRLEEPGRDLRRVHGTASSRGGRMGGSSAAAWSHVEKEITGILAWRRRRGLDRSIDRGTRWVVFESALPSLVRSIDRGLRGFLRQLAIDGLFRRRGGWDVYVGFVRDTQEDQEGRLVVRVSAEFAGEYGAALTQSIDAGRSIVASEF